ncbi:MAG: N-acetyltransferase family protein [Cyanobacteria bacterium P01_H01_bin.15]
MKEVEAIAIAQNPSFETLIRDATPPDWPVILDIYNAAIPGRLATGDLQPVSLAQRRDWFQAHSPQRRPLWVYEQGGQVIAWISANSFYGRPAYGATAEFSLYVAPDYHGQGIGKYLLKQLIATCPELGISTLLGFIFAHNQASLRLSEKLGFERWGFLPEVAAMEGIQRDLVIMGRKISDAAPNK